MIIAAPRRAPFRGERTLACRRPRFAESEDHPSSRHEQVARRRLGEVAHLTSVKLLSSIHAAPSVSVAAAGVYPDLSGVGGAGLLESVIGALITIVLVVAVLMIVACAAGWALCSFSGNYSAYSAAVKARTGLLWPRRQDVHQVPVAALDQNATGAVERAVRMAEESFRERSRLERHGVCGVAVREQHGAVVRVDQPHQLEDEYLVRRSLAKTLLGQEEAPGTHFTMNSVPQSIALAVAGITPMLAAAQRRRPRGPTMRRHAHSMPLTLGGVKVTGTEAPADAAGPATCASVELLTPRQVSGLTQMSYHAVLRAINDGELVASRLRGRLRVRRVDFDAWVEGVA